MLTLLSDFLGLDRNLERGPLSLDLFIVLHQVVGDLRLGDPDTYDLNARRPHSRALLQRVSQLLVQRVEVVNEHLLQGVLAAELVDLMTTNDDHLNNKGDLLNLVENPYFIVEHGVVLNGLLSEVLPQAVDHLDLLEKDVDTAGRTARHIVDLVGLKSDLDILHRRDDRKHRVPAGLLEALKDGATSEVDSNVALGYLVEPIEHQDRDDKQSAEDYA